MDKSVLTSLYKNSSVMISTLSKHTYVEAVPTLAWKLKSYDVVKSATQLKFWLLHSRAYGRLVSIQYKVVFCCVVPVSYRE